MQKLTIDNIEYELQQDAYISDNNETYQAVATDKDGNQYQIYWDILTDDDQGDDRNSCDWDKPYKIVELY